MPRIPISHPLALQRLRQAQQSATGPVDVLAAAIAIATHAHPTLEGPKIHEALDRFALDVQHFVRKDNPPQKALQQVLFMRYGFYGNAEHYRDPRNSYIDTVLSRRTGLPILLSLIYVQTARRSGCVAHGIGLPGHFIAALDLDGDPTRRLYIDAFHRGAILSMDDCRRAAHSAGTPWHDEFLQPADPSQWALRILNNLRTIYRDMGNGANTAAVLEQMLILDPTDTLAARELQATYQILDDQIAKNN